MNRRLCPAESPRARCFGVREAQHGCWRIDACTCRGSTSGCGCDSRTAPRRASTARPSSTAVRPRTRACWSSSSDCTLVRGWGHTLFRWESLLNTPLFVGFPGFVSKLWLAHDEHDVYRGIYEWDGPARAEYYARCLWRILALGCVPGSIHYMVLPGLRRDEVLTGPAPARCPGAARSRGVVATRRGRMSRCRDLLVVGAGPTGSPWRCRPTRMAPRSGSSTGGPRPLGRRAR